MVKGMSSWELTMMGLGTVVGGSFFLGVAVALRTAGPSVIISYILGGALVYVILVSLSEMTVADPAPGSFRTFAARAYGPGLGFVVGWTYWTGLILAMSSEATAVAILLREWFPDLSITMVGSMIIIGVTLLNLLGAEKLGKLESGLAAVKLLAIVGFIIFGLLLVIGLIPGIPSTGLGEVTREPFFTGGLGGIPGSMLVVMFTYAGFEIIGLAASETNNPVKTVPRAVRSTVFGLIGLYVTSVAILLFLIPTATLTEEVSPFVEALSRHGLGWVGTVLSYVLVSAILSTMLAAVFGLGRMIRSLAEEGQAPSWIKGKGDIPFRGILFSGAAMLIGMGLGFFLPQRVYMFLISSGGFALLFTYTVIIASHMKFRKNNGCSQIGGCQLPGYPFISWITLISLVAIIGSMPLVPGQGAGLTAGLSLLTLFSLTYIFMKRFRVSLPKPAGRSIPPVIGTVRHQPNIEVSEELMPQKDKK